jgi:hypothetical protein
MARGLLYVIVVAGGKSMLLALLRLHIYCETSVTKTQNFGKPCRIFYVRSNKVLYLFVLEVCVEEVACVDVDGASVLETHIHAHLYVSTPTHTVSVYGVVSHKASHTLLQFQVYLLRFPI